ncbi:MAG: anhydro-N-acetylmuramic acid kinase [Gammaproteobacteria bacterium]|nr:anhydro-N-acetylmuramic acid kinase [Gammaproteobacteria bacterium]
MAYFIGVMSGTSLDGIDVAVCSFSRSGQFTFIAAETYPFPSQLQHDLQQLINNPHCSLLTLGELDIALGQLIGESINSLLNTQQISSNDIVAIGSHGQTLFHSPNGDLPFSMQIGNANTIAEITGITTITDFRQRDIAAGGQGAPLVPAFHQALFHDKDEDRLIVNIGRISNITLLPASLDTPVIGFDTGPGNCLLDYWTVLHLNKTFDKNGQWAASGQVNENLLAIFLNEPYFKQTIPKSTGRELFNSLWLDNKLTEYGHKIAPQDIQATLAEFTARTIVADIKMYADSASTIYICGGGVHNEYLFGRIQHLLENKQVSTTKDLGLHPDWVEACAFAWLAFRTINKQTGNLMAVTGAQHPSVLGAIYSA